MAILNDKPLVNPEAIRHFESAMTLEERLPERSVYDVFKSGAARHPNSIALTMLMTGSEDERPRQVTYAELFALITRCANLFSTTQSSPPCVAFLLPNLPETHGVLWGAEVAGVVLPLNPLLSQETLLELLRAANTTVLVALGPAPGSDIWTKAEWLAARLPVELFCAGVAGGPPPPGAADLMSCLQAQPADQLLIGIPRGGHDTAAYMHTGGTTGTPKLAALTHRGQLVAAFGGAVLSALRPGEVVTGAMPLFHCAGVIYSSLSVFLAGAHSLVMSPSGLRNPTMVKRFWHLVSKWKVGLAGGAPTSIGSLVDIPTDGADLSALRAGVTGTAPLPPSLANRWHAVTGRPLAQVYGMTEASGLISLQPPGVECPSASVGWRIPYTEVAIFKHPGGFVSRLACVPNEVGLIAVRGPTVSPGYARSEHNAGVFADGWLVTGDLGFTDQNGALHVAGRAKDLIIRGGHNIDPAMIEDALTAHPAVALAAAVGMPDGYAGELPVCYVVLRAGMNATEDELQAHAQRTVSERPAWPRYVEIVDQMPLTAIGKIYKPALRCHAAKRHFESVLSERNLPLTSITVTEGSRYGLRVELRVPERYKDGLGSLQAALARYPFEIVIVPGL